MGRKYKEHNLVFSKKDRNKAKRKIKKEIGIINGNENRYHKVNQKDEALIKQKKVNTFLNQSGSLVVEKKNEIRFDIKSLSQEEAILFSSVLLGVITYDSKYAKPLMCHIRELGYRRDKLFVLNNKICTYSLKLDKNGHDNYPNDINHAFPHLHYYFFQKNANNIFNKKFIKGHIFWKDIQKKP